MLQYERYTKSKQNSIPWFDFSKGDVFISGGKTFAFDRFPKGAKSVYATCMEDSKSYKVTKREEFIIVGKYEFPVKDVDTDCDRKNLKKDELFVIADGDKPGKLFRFSYQNPKSVIAINVISGGKATIANGFRFIKLENLKY